MLDHFHRRLISHYNNISLADFEFGNADPNDQPWNWDYYQNLMMGKIREINAHVYQVTKVEFPWIQFFDAQMEYDLNSFLGLVEYQANHVMPHHYNNPAISCSRRIIQWLRDHGGV